MPLNRAFQGTCRDGLPSNRLEALKGDKAGQWFIRINQQWRVCFEWPTDVSGPSKR